MVLNQENGRYKTTYGEYSKAGKYVRFFSLVLLPVFIQSNINAASTCIGAVMSSANQNKV